MIRAVLVAALLLLLVVGAILAVVAAVQLTTHRRRWARVAGVVLMVGLVVILPAIALEASAWAMP